MRGERDDKVDRAEHDAHRAFRHDASQKPLERREVMELANRLAAHCGRGEERGEVAKEAAPQADFKL